jgi:alkylated DNA nucleotide flippase Atl1
MSGVKKEQLEKRRKDVIDAIKELGGVATPTQVAKLLGNGIKGENIRKCMGRMAEDGVLVRVERGLYRVVDSGILEGKGGGLGVSERKELVEDVSEDGGGSLDVEVESVSERKGGNGGVKELVVKALLGEVKSVYALYVKYDFWKWFDSTCIMCPDMKVVNKVKALIGERYKMLTPSQLRGFVSIIAETKGKTVGEVLDEAFIGWEEISV